MGQRNDEELTNLLNHLMRDWENEVVEFKEGGKGYSTGEIGQYVSALSNEANLRDADSAWLIFGVKDRSRRIIGTEYRQNAEKLQRLKHEISDGTEPGITFRNIYELKHPEGRILLFEIPPAPRGMPIAWNGHFYGRAGESLVALSLDKLDLIRVQESAFDWSAQTVPDATIDDIDPEAMRFARQAFTERHAPRISAEEVESWSDEDFLRHLGLLNARGLTRTALLLLGKPQVFALLSPLMAEMTWKLVGQEEAYEHFQPPFILNTTRLYQRIRNIKIRLMPPGELIQREIEKYDQQTVLEALHNCIAHQDYRQHARIVVTEYPDRLEFISQGGFVEGSPDEFALKGHLPKRYRNPLMVQAMTELNMIDHLGYGIERMNRSQASRYLPLPDYDLSDPNEVRLTIYGSVVDESYTRMLMLKSNLPFEDILALDRVQKHQPIPATTARRLRRQGLIEGRKPNLYVSEAIANATGTQAEYVRARSHSNEYYISLVLDYLRQYGNATREQLNDLLYPAFVNNLTEEQKSNKVKNILSSMRTRGLARNEFAGRSSIWYPNEEGSSTNVSKVSD
ncbi:putative DNA binding domain-containing protein [Bifidobacterium sp. LC6]|uniref:DNA binding domain-containing protein n=1 Tax=Bifidobacterium colobi TaxID=2809026 RepID=A0ABS5UXY6_9BIFI|nr:RNA-binding domain-containing protein [Bifidobacterium colobi]MBT1175658.1 putative DNA binding domain-containing protein [Bifidobacterium colobi]